MRAEPGHGSCFVKRVGNLDNRAMKTRQVRIAIGALALAIILPAAAQSPSDRPLPGQQPQPAAKPKAAAAAPAGDRKLQPLPEPPPPPPGLELDPSFEPSVTIQRRGTETVEEFRIRGRLYMVKVTPSHGVPYYLIDENGRGDFTRRDSFDTGTRPPMWVIHSW
jgi:hypothetical protein